MNSSTKPREEHPAALECLRARIAELERALADQEQLLAALRASEERSELAVRGSADGLWDWNIETGDLWWSPQCRELLG